MLITTILFALSLAADSTPDTRPALTSSARAKTPAADTMPALYQLQATGLLPSESRYLIVSLAERRVYLVDEGRVRFTAGVAIGKGTSIDSLASRTRFATPRGRFSVTRKDSMPLWVPPEWHYAPLARKAGVRLRSITAGDTIHAQDGSLIFTRGTDVMRQARDGSEAPAASAQGAVRVDGFLVMPPMGSAQRKVPAVLGTRRLYLVDGYGIHGTNEPSSIGKAVSHGCIRMKNSAIEKLYPMVPAGTPVYIR